MGWRIWAGVYYVNCKFSYITMTGANAATEFYTRMGVYTIVLVQYMVFILKLATIQ